MSRTDTLSSPPTWMADVRHYFTPEDIDHMGRRGIDLATYDGVREHAIRILGATEPPDATMPPDPSRRWDQDRWDRFKQWIVAGYPLGTPEAPALAFGHRAVRAGQRVRRNASSLSPADIALLSAAFTGIRDLPVDDPRSYFALAGLHWLPPPTYCLHHENRYNPWHRAYLNVFEDALRTIPGCENVALPYWDITSPVPDFLYQPPFDSYTLPRDIGNGFTAGYTTIRHPAHRIQQNVEDFGIAGQITDALSRPVWSQFNSVIIRAHDNGHGSIGETVGQQDVAAYDPIFWFFHANLDRLWWRWQEALSATTVTGLLGTVLGSTDWLRTAPFNVLPPFGVTADQTIDLSGVGVSYEHPATDVIPLGWTAGVGSLPASTFRGLRDERQVSVRVKGIDRLNIPGSFVIHLVSAGETIAKQAFFQANEPRSCSACAKQGKVDVDLTTTLDRLGDGPMRIEIEPLWPGAIGSTFPLTSAGNPTINMRLLLR
jgi:tyrosinase